MMILIVYFNFGIFKLKASNIYNRVLYFFQNVREVTNLVISEKEKAFYIKFTCSALMMHIPSSPFHSIFHKNFSLLHKFYLTEKLFLVLN